MMMPFVSAAKRSSVASPCPAIAPIITMSRRTSREMIEVTPLSNMAPWGLPMRARV